MNNPLFTIRITRDIPLSSVRAFVEETLSNYFGKPIAWIEFKTECCHRVERWYLKDIPLEDFNCSCGETPLIKYIREE